MNNYIDHLIPEGQCIISIDLGTGFDPGGFQNPFVQSAMDFYLAKPICGEKIPFTELIYALDAGIN